MRSFPDILGSKIIGFSIGSTETYDIAGSQGMREGNCFIVEFDTGYLSIDNLFFVKNNGLNVDDLNELIGCVVKESKFDECAFVILLDPCYEISISLLPEDYSGPEAACYHSKTGSIVVFN